MRSQAKALPAESTDGRGAHSWKATAALLAAVALVVSGFSAAPALGASTQVLDSAVPHYTTVDLSGTVDAAPGFGNTEIYVKVSTDGTNFSTGAVASCPPGSYAPNPDPPFSLCAIHSGPPLDYDAVVLGMHPNTTYYFRLDLNRAGERVSSNVVTTTTLPVAKPAVLSINDAAAVSYLTAQATGVVEGVDAPSEDFVDDFKADCRFEYVSDAQFAETGFEPVFDPASPKSDPVPPPSAPCDVNPIVDSEPTQVKTELTNLAPGTTYHLRLVARNAGGADIKAASSTFTTLPVASPTVLEVDDALNVTYSRADVSGKIERPAGPDPAAFDAHCRFQYVSAEQFLATGFDGAAETECDPEAATATGETEVSATLTGLAVGTTYHLRLRATNAGGSDFKESDSTFTTLVPDAPIVSIAPPTDVTSTSAHFAGEIDPGGTDPNQNVSWHFQCTPACPGLEGTVEADGLGSRQISAEATGLKANTAYEVTLVASNVAAQAIAGPEAFTTVTVKPVVTTFPAFALAGGTKVLAGGRVDPENDVTRYWIEYGPDETYGASFPPAQDASVGPGDDPTFVTQEVTGLQPSTTYHFRLVASNSVGVRQGADKTFTTSPAGGLGSSIGGLRLPDNRAWEMVSPVDKNRAGIWKVKAQASASGDTLSFLSQGSFAGQPTAKGGTLSDYLSKRGASSWVTQGVTPPGGLFSVNEAGYHEFSEELDFGRLKRKELNGESLDPEFGETALEPESQPAPNEPTASFRFYIRGNTTGEYKLQPRGFRGASADYSHIALQSDAELTPEGCTFFCVYEKVTGEPLRLASKLPDGNFEYGEYAGISKDGSHVYFTALNTGHLFARVDGVSSVQIDESERTVPPVGGGSPASLAGIEGASGERVLIRSGEELVDADEDSANDLYVWDGAKPAGQRLTLVSQGDIPGVEADFGQVLSSAGDRFAEPAQSTQRGYFTAANQLIAGEPDAAGQKIYFWKVENGATSLSYVATADFTSVAPQYSEINIAQIRTSRDGRYLAFGSKERLTAYDNAGEEEVYRYDGYTAQLVCVSCDPLGDPATSSARLQGINVTEATFGTRHALRNLSDNGRLFFETAEGLVPGDSNGQFDVYEYSDGAPHLISSGQGNEESRFLDASTSGDDVFFATAENLVGWDHGDDVDVYDARVDGGLPEPPPPLIGCDGDACQPPPTPPNDPTPASSTFNGAGNVGKKLAPRKAHKKKQRKKKRHGTKQRQSSHATQKRG